MQVKAHAKYIRMSPRKVRLVADLVRGLPIEQARHQLMFSPKLAAKPILKVLESAIANAKNNFSLESKDLSIMSIMIDEGPTIKRFMPRAQGRATPLRKRMSHIRIAVGIDDKKVEGTKSIKGTGGIKSEKASEPVKSPKATKEEKSVKAKIEKAEKVAKVTKTSKAKETNN
jgi:large subunit ribosomal protein L22